MGRQGTATLPLHTGSAPRWLFDRMETLGGAIADVIIRDYGQDELLRRLADPYWFQAFGCALGFDWHSSGLTTTTMGALKEALDPVDHGVVVVGGKGATSRQTPDEIDEASLGIGGTTKSRLKRHSRLSATVDNACLQDQFSIYHHTMIITEDGEWCVIQQGMDDARARRYHWLSESIDSFIEEPQSAICSQPHSNSVLDMTATASAEARDVSVDLVNDDPTHLSKYFTASEQRSLFDFSPTDNQLDSGPRLTMPTHHELRERDLTDRTIQQLQRAYEYQPEDYTELIDIDGIGPKSLRALALIAELVHDADSSRRDPAKYAYTHGGKDGTPHPVDRERYDNSIEFVQLLLEQAEADRAEKRDAFKRLSQLR